MFKKRVLLLIGIALLLILIAPSVLAEFGTGQYAEYRFNRRDVINIWRDDVTTANSKCTVYDLRLEAATHGAAIDTSPAMNPTAGPVLGPKCVPNEYSVILGAGCRDGRTLPTFGGTPYSNLAYAACARYSPYHERAQFLDVTYACCPYDSPEHPLNPELISSPAEDNCDFLVEPDLDGIPPNCPDVPNTQAYIDAGWVFPSTYNYRALDCEPGDDDLVGKVSATGNIIETIPHPETAKEDYGLSTFGDVLSKCNDKIDNDCDGVIDDPEDCDADYNSNLCADDGGTDSPFGWVSGLGENCCEAQTKLQDAGQVINKYEKETGTFQSYVCGDDPEGDYISKWFLPTDKGVEIGDIMSDDGDYDNDGAADGEFVTDGTSWFTCNKYTNKITEIREKENVVIPDASFEKTTIKDHDFVCYEKEPNSQDESREIAECWGPLTSTKALSRNSLAGANNIYTGSQTNPSLLLHDNFQSREDPSFFSLAKEEKIITANGLFETPVGTLADVGLDISADDSKLIYEADGNIDHRKGRVEFWVKPKWDSDVDNKDRVFFNLQEDEDNYLRISKLRDGKIECIINSRDRAYKKLVDVNLVEDTWYNIKMSWAESLDQFSCSVDDVEGELVDSERTLEKFPKAETFSLGMVPDKPELVAEAIFDELKIYRNPNPVDYYCTDDFRWEADLDEEKYKTACKRADGLDWTGTKCCGETVDKPEYYNDVPDDLAEPDYDERGACWDSKWVDWGELPFGEKTKPEDPDAPINIGPVINYKGQLTACLPDAELTAMEDVDDKPLLIGAEACDVLEDARIGEKDFYCSVDKNWKLASPYNTKDPLDDLTTSVSRTFKSFPWVDTSVLQQDCCTADECWNGEFCVKNQQDDAQYILFNDYRCLDGEWKKMEPKLTWNRQEKGFCPADTQCLVQPGGESSKNNNPSAYFTENEGEQPQCINNGQYIKQYYCEDGEWGTRTKLIALQLIEHAAPKGDYELFCGNFDDVLTYVGYDPFGTVGSDKIAVQSYLDQCEDRPCVNQFCAVKYAEGIAFGTSLNFAVNQDSKSFVKFALGKDIDLCDGTEMGDEDYDLCGENVYYNDDTESIVVLQRGTLGEVSTTDLLENRNFEIENRFENLQTYAEPKFLTQGPSLSHQANSILNTTTLFENIFVIKKGARDYFAYLEENQYAPVESMYADYIGLTYDNFITKDNPCGTNFIGQKTGEYPRTCSYLNNNLNFLGLYPAGEIKENPAGVKEPSIKQLWKGLTSQLRIS